MSNIKRWFSFEISNAAFNIRSCLSVMNKKNLKETAFQINEFLSSTDDDFIYFQWYKLALDIIESKLYKPPKPMKKKSIPKYKLNIEFVSKALNFINLPQILRSTNVKENSPILMEETDVPMVVYSLSQTIRSKVLNYKKFVCNLDLESFSRNIKSIPCHCSEYDNSFIDPNCKHVLTGDLNIIKNNKLRKLLSKGPKYREPDSINWNLAKIVIDASLDSYIEHLAKIKGVSRPYFSNWKHTILENVDSKVTYFSPRIRKRETVSVLDDISVKNELKTLRNNFILVPIDKASNNVSLICKQHYATLIKTEVGYSARATRQSDKFLAYEEVSNTCPADIIDKHSNDLPLFGLTVEEEI